MGRPKLATSERLDVIRSVRLKPLEAHLLMRHFGSVSKALRYLVDAYFRGDLGDLPRR